MREGKVKVGQIYGDLEVLSFSKKYKKNLYWNCKCSCGNIKEVSSERLLRGTIKHCGCKKYKQKDITGERFGKLLVLKRVENAKDNRPMYLCQCECGTIKKIRSDNLLKKYGTRSCGCSSIIAKNYKHGYCYRGHRKRLHIIWCDMKRRCDYSKDKFYYRYGGRGIIVCDEWKNDFSKFEKWATANGYNDTLTIDRIDNNGNYEPSNCRFVDIKKQANNKCNNHLVLYKNELKTLKQVAEAENINYDRFKYLLRYHKMAVEDAIENTKHKIKYMKKESV